MRLEPTKPYIISQSGKVALVTLNKKEVIYPGNIDNKGFILTAIYEPLRGGSRVEIDCGRSRTSGNFIADELLSQRCLRNIEMYLTNLDLAFK